MGTIHYWLFNKIKIVEDRERFILEEFAGRYGAKPYSLGKELQEKYAPYFDDAPLEKLIGNNSIHAFLARTIGTVETREAAVIKALMDSYGSQAGPLLLDAAYRHGGKNGKSAREEYSSSNPVPDEVYRVLRNYILDGMPCDHVVEVNQDSDRLVIERHADCLHRVHWQNAGMTEEFMCDYHCRWIDGFVDSFSPTIKHSRTKSIARGDPNCEDVFKKE